jgi:hypothetical protein
MIVLTQISGVETPMNGKSHIFAHKDRCTLAIKTSGGLYGLSVPPSLASGLLDVWGSYASSTTPHWNGTSFVPTSLLAGATPVPYASSGNTGNVRVIIASGTFPPGTSGYITWQSIPQTYQHLEIVGEYQSVSGVTALGQVLMYFNNDTTQANYATRRLRSATHSTANLAQDVPISLSSQGVNGGVGNYRTALHLYIPNYTDAHHKWCYSDYIGYNLSGTDQTAETNGTQWENTAAITRVDFFTSSALVVNSGTVLYLIGVGHSTVNGSGLHGNTKIANGLVIP